MSEVPDYSLHSPYGPPFGRSTRFALLSATLHPGYACFVSEGQIAEIKVETFPFSKYGALDAEVINDSNDAVIDEEKGLIYAARVLMKDATIRVNNKMVNLTPGMAVTVEVKTGTRRLIEFVLSPLLRYRDEGLRER